MNYALHPCCPFWNILSSRPPLLSLSNLPFHLFPSISICLPLPISLRLLHLLPVPILPSLWGWQSHIRHVIRREMWDSGRGELGAAIEWCYRPSSPLHWPAAWHLQAGRSAPQIHLLYRQLSVASHHMSSTIPQYQTYSSSRWGVTKTTCCCPTHCHWNIQRHSYIEMEGVHRC